MSGRCREVAGILFKKRCKLMATQTCVQCNKPTCHLHIRVISQRPLCITCARTAAQDPQMRHSMGFLHDDPYFYWYYESDHWFDDDYGDADYDLFSSGSEGSFDADIDDHWEGT